jgi:hypothetical protein
MAADLRYLPARRVHAPVHFEDLDHTIQLGGDFRIQSDGDAPPIEAAGVNTVAPASDGLRVTLQLSPRSFPPKLHRTNLQLRSKPSLSLHVLLPWQISIVTRQTTSIFVTALTAKHFISAL